MSRVTLTDVLEMSIAERIQLVEDIWDSIAALPEALTLTEAQRQELDRRLNDHLANPNDVIPWEEVKKGFLGRR